MLLGAIMDHYSTGNPIVLETNDPKEDLEFNIEESLEDAEIISQIKERT